MEMEEKQVNTNNSHPEQSRTASNPNQEKPFSRTWSGILTLAEIIFGLLVWVLIVGTDYFHMAIFGWVIFASVFYWVLTFFFYIMYVSLLHTRIPKVPWTTVDLIFNGSAVVLYLMAAVLNAIPIRLEKTGDHTFNMWTASTVFAFVVTLCYAAHTYFSFKAWISRNKQQS